MLKNVGTIIRKIAAKVTGLNDQDIQQLNEVAPELILRVRDNTTSNIQDVFDGLTDEDKKLLLAFVVYKRQNITTGPTDNPNSEDAAKILHGELYEDVKDSEADDMIDKNLREQLNKAGLKVPRVKKVKTLKKNKGD
jgi:hypothetical protein